METEHTIRQKRLAEIRAEIESAGYVFEFNTASGRAKCFKNEELVHVPRFDKLILEYELLRFKQVHIS